MNSWLKRYNPLFWTATTLAALTIFYMSSLSFPAGPSKMSILPILYHIISFFFLSLFLFVASTKLKKIKLLPLAIIISIIYGILDELHQFFVPGRTTTLFDVGLDTIGIIFALMIYFIIYKLKKN